VIGMERGLWRVVRMVRSGSGMLGGSRCCLGTLGCGSNAMHEYAFNDRLVEHSNYLDLLKSISSDPNNAIYEAQTAAVSPRAIRLRPYIGTARERKIIDLLSVPTAFSTPIEATQDGHPFISKVELERNKSCASFRAETHVALQYTKPCGRFSHFLHLTRPQSCWRQLTWTLKKLI
jgi:hypothetical protein